MKTNGADAGRNDILIVEDEPDLVNLLVLHLGEAGYVPDVAFDGREGLQKAISSPYGLVILDVMLPELDGMEVCKRIRAADRHVPILMLTSRAEELDKVLGLEFGADDYVTKPFSVRELVARVKAIFRRVEIDQRESVRQDAAELHCGEIVIYPAKRKVTLGGRPVEMTAKEFDLLHLFAQNPGRAYSRQELLDLVWGYQYSGYSHTVNSHINRLRAKIEADPSTPKYIQTVWGLGYRFIEHEELPA